MDSLLVIMVVFSFILLLFVNVGAVATLEPTLLRFVAIYWKLLSLPVGMIFAMILLASYGIVSVRQLRGIIVFEPLGFIAGVVGGLIVIMSSFLIVGVARTIPKLEVTPSVMVALLVTGAIIETALFWVMLPEILDTLFWLFMGYKYLSMLLASVLSAITFGLLHVWAYGYDISLLSAILSAFGTSLMYLALRDKFPSIGSGLVVAHIIWNLFAVYG